MHGLVDIGVRQSGSLYIGCSCFNTNSFTCRKNFTLSLTTFNFTKQLITMVWFHTIGAIGLTFLATKRFRTNSPSILNAPCTTGPVSKPECAKEASMLLVALGDWARILLGNSARTLCPNIAKEGRDSLRCVEYSKGEKSAPWALEKWLWLNAM